MKETPLLFSASMVIAILNGSKTQTRRVIKPQPQTAQMIGPRMASLCYPGMLHRESPYGCFGDRIWIREQHYRWGRFFRGKWRLRPDSIGRDRDGFLEPAKTRSEMGWHKRPPIFMPHDRHCITLEIVSVRVERVRDITEADAMAEGVKRYDHSPPAAGFRFMYSLLWDSLNAKRGFGWDKNPWCWVLAFKRIKP